MENLNVDTSSWTLFEHQVFSYRYCQCDEVFQYGLHEGIKQRFRESILANFLYEFNKVQLQEVHVQQDKLERVIFDIEKRLENINNLQRRNDIVEDLLGLVQKLILNNITGKITVKNTLRNIEVLRLTGSKIGSMDDCLCMLPELLVLILAGNCLLDLSGSCLPRNLLLLELCCNKVQDVSLLLQNSPPHLFYLGLARNFITQDMIQPVRWPQYLYHLDLAHNDIKDLAAVVTTCLGLVNLTSLMLIGNPCSMVASYKDVITSKLPKLIFLDGKTFKKEQKTLKSKFDYELSGTLQISVFRIMGLPQPPTQKINKKKVIHTFRVEVECPFLQSYASGKDDIFVMYNSLKSNDCNEIKLSQQKYSKTEMRNKIEIKTGGTKGKKSKTKSTKKSDNANKKFSKKSEAKESKVDEEGLQEARIYENMLEEDEHYSELCFLSERKNWAKIIEFIDPTIEVPNCDLTLLRNVFRSNMFIRLVHLKTLPPFVENNKGKRKKQEKIKIFSEEVDESYKDANKEILIAQTTVAKFKVPLQDILWNVKSLDYSWSKMTPLKVELTPGLKDLHYDVKKKKPAKKRHVNEKENSTEVQMPEALTCHLGIGVKRTHSNNSEQE